MKNFGVRMVSTWLVVLELNLEHQNVYLNADLIVWEELVRNQKIEKYNLRSFEKMGIIFLFIIGLCIAKFHPLFSPSLHHEHQGRPSIEET